MKRNSRIRIIYIWMITYMFVLLIPICVNFVLYNNYSSKFEVEVLNYNRLLAERVANEYDKQITNCINFTYALENDAQLREIAAFHVDWDKQQLSRVNEYVREKIKVYSGQFPQDFCIYFKSSQAVIKPDYVSRGNVAYEVWGREYAKDYAEWISKVNNIYKYEFVMDSSYRFVVFHTLFAGTESEATVVARVADKKLLSFEKSFFTDGGRTVAICKPGGVSEVTAYGSTLKLDFSGKTAKSGILNFNADGKHKIIALYNKSSIIDRVYVIMTVDEFFNNVQLQMRRTWLITVAVCLVAGIAFACMFSYYNYAPLQKILSKFGGAKRKNEYLYIENMIENMQFANEQQRKDRTLSELMTKPGYTASVKKYVEREYGIDSKTKVTAAIIFLQDVSNFVSEDNVEKDSAALCFALENIFEEMMRQNGCRAYMICSNGLIKAVICSDRRRLIAEISEEFLKIVKQELNVSCLVAVGDTVFGGENIYVSHSHASGVLDCMLFTDDFEAVGLYDPEKAVRYEAEIKKLEKTVQLCVVKNDAEGIKNALVKFFGTGEKKPCLSEMQLVLRDVTNTIREKAESMQPDGADYSGLRECLNVVSFEEYIRQLSEFLNMCREQNGKEEKNFFLQIRDYVDQNICDPNLTNGKIADRFKISEVYLSRYFKSNYSGGLLNYITKKRIDMAKIILKETDKTLNEISEAVGFSNSLTMLRAFKKHEGITPTQYREINK